MTRGGLCAVCRSVICCNRFLPRGGPMMLSTSARPLSLGWPRSRFWTCRLLLRDWRSPMRSQRLSLGTTGITFHRIWIGAFIAVSL